MSRHLACVKQTLDCIVGVDPMAASNAALIPLMQHYFHVVPRQGPIAFSWDGDWFHGNFGCCS
jgi:hypothetical protein